ncbi:MAG: glycosyltransferase family 9 protein [Candidatus Krumholzibacteriia bacterium]
MSGRADEAPGGTARRLLRRVTPAPAWRAGRDVRDLLRSAAARHRAAARLRALRAFGSWRMRRAGLTRAAGAREVVGVCLLEHLGDIVAAEPVAGHVRSRHPDAVLVWVVSRRYADLVRHHPQVDAILELGCLTEWIHLRERRLFDRLYDLNLHGRDCAVCHVPLQRPPQERTVTVKNYYDHGCLLDVFCAAAGLPRLAAAPRLHLPPAAEAAAEALSLPPRFVTIHGRSHQDARDWRPERWRALVEALVQEHGVSVVEVGLQSALDRPPRDAAGARTSIAGGADRPAVAGATVAGAAVAGATVAGPVAAEEAAARYVDLCGRLSLAQTAAVVRRAELFVGIDSGPAHLAAAAGVSGVVLLGHYRHYRSYVPYSGPWADGSGADLVRNFDGPAADLPVERVLAAVLRRLDAAGRDRPAGALPDGGRR